MSQENVERLRAAIDALRSDTSELDWEATLAGAWVELWDPGIEWDASNSSTAGPRRGLPGNRAHASVVARVARRLGSRPGRVRAGRGRRPRSRAVPPAHARALHGH